jgi:hypothetical protein
MTSREAFGESNEACNELFRFLNALPSNTNYLRDLLYLIRLPILLSDSADNTLSTLFNSILSIGMPDN